MLQIARFLFLFCVWLYPIVCICVCANPLQSCPALRNPMNCSLPGSSVLGISQARTLDWVAIPFSKGSSLPRGRTWSPTLQADFYRLNHQGCPSVTIGTTKKAAVRYAQSWTGLKCPEWSVSNFRMVSRVWMTLGEIKEKNHSHCFIGYQHREGITTLRNSYVTAEAFWPQ